MTAKFSLGDVVITPAAHALCESKDPLLVSVLLARHRAGDWGNLCEEDKKVNDDAVVSGDRILSAYKIPGGEKVWIITEHDRSVSTVLLPEEY